MNKNKKEEQILTNEAAVNLFDIAVSTITANSPRMNLDYCNAEMIFTDDYVILKSYETLIACYNKRLAIFVMFSVMNALPQIETAILCIILAPQFSI